LNIVDLVEFNYYTFDRKMPVLERWCSRVLYCPCRERNQMRLGRSL